jgi:CubicO group peptidase (beta-lactamase class C family)
VDRVLPNSELDRALTQAVEQFDVQSLKTGYGLCLFDARGPIWSNYHGSSDREGRIPFSPDTRFHAEAISELLTAARVLQLVEEGKMSLDAPVARYLPAVFSGAADGSSLARVGALKIGIILSHLSGVPAKFFLNFREYRPLENIRQFLENATPQFPPGAKYHHASGLIDLVGLAIQEVEARPFDAAMSKALFEPLGMASSSFQYRDDPRNAVSEYGNHIPFEEESLAQVSDWNQVQAPSSSLVTSLGDLVPFYSMVLGRGSWNGQRILSSESVSAMLSPRNEKVARRQGIQVGYIWMLSVPELSYLGRVAWCSGKFVAHRNAVILAEDLGVGVAVATNYWDISERQVIFPLAVEVLRAYAAQALGKVAPPATPSHPVTLPSDLRRQVAGNYASPFGVYRVTAERDGIDVAWNSGTQRLVHGGDGQFLSEESGEIARIFFSPPGSLTAYLRNGVIADAKRVARNPQTAYWNQVAGIYRIADRSDFRKIPVYAFTITSRDGLLIIGGDDAREYWLRPTSPRAAEIVCHEASLFHGKTLEVRGKKEIRLGGVLFERAGRVGQ